MTIWRLKAPAGQWWCLRWWSHYCMRFFLQTAPTKAKIISAFSPFVSDKFVSRRADVSTVTSWLVDCWTRYCMERWCGLWFSPILRMDWDSFEGYTGKRGRYALCGKFALIFNLERSAFSKNPQLKFWDFHRKNHSQLLFLTSTNFVISDTTQISAVLDNSKFFYFSRFHRFHPKLREMDDADAIDEEIIVVEAVGMVSTGREIRHLIPVIFSTSQITVIKAECNELSICPKQLPRSTSSSRRWGSLATGWITISEWELRTSSAH